ncbi:MAG: type VII toxin-antitoxin system MntA family adenylyltransferase antitoxin [Candidatus Hadarchaeum sp.]|uniref:type VII toxin-antitoxin system MntA family adenylyltransferase antitoxin n=1 Tax=Candidatus Hadarchaeum sp. TaxID=2883567 RepID=UPI003D0D2ECC
MGEKEEIIKKIVETLWGFKEVELAYVFGSFYAGREFEDIDIAILLSKPPSAYESERFAMKVAGALETALGHKFEFDVKVLNFSPIYFQHEVIRDGKLLFCRDETKRVEYEAGVLSEYLDYREVLDWFDEKLLARA